MRLVDGGGMDWSVDALIWFTAGHCHDYEEVPPPPPLDI